MPTDTFTSACRGPEEAKRMQELNELCKASMQTQANYRQLHHALRSVVKTKGQMHAHIKPDAPIFPQGAYNAHSAQLNPQIFEDFKTGRIAKEHFLVKTRLELQDMLATAEKQQSMHRRAARKEANKAFADQHKGFRRAAVAARPPPQPPMVCIRHKDKPCFDPASIDAAYDDLIGSMFEGEEGGYSRRLARAGAFIDKYADVIHAGDQFPIKPLNAIAIHSILTSTGSVAASFDHIYHRDSSFCRMPTRNGSP